MNQMREALKRIDVQRIAGIRRILGVDLGDGAVRIVELEKEGGLLNKYGSRFKPVQYVTCHFRNDASVEEKSIQTADLIRSHGITTRCAVGTVRSRGVKTIVATIPQHASRIQEWIEENFEKLLRVPLPASEVSYDYEVLGYSDTGTQIEITFVRNPDLDLLRSYFQNAGLKLLALGGGTRDAVNGVVFESAYSHGENTSLVFIDPPVCSVTRLNRGRRGVIREVYLQGNDDVHNAIAELTSSKDQGNSTVCMTGLIDSGIQADDWLLVNPFGLPSEYALAGGLAVKGFLPELSPMNFLSKGERENNSVAMYKSVTNRVALFLSSIMIFLLALQLTASWLIQSRMEAVQEQIASVAPEYSSLAMLRRDVEHLEMKLAGSSGSRTYVAETLHDIAAATPENVWLYRLQASHAHGESQQISLYGYSTSNDAITLFLKQLQLVCSDVRLVRSSLPLQSETFIPATIGSSSFMTFEIKATGRN